MSKNILNIENCDDIFINSSDYFNSLIYSNSENYNSAASFTQIGDNNYANDNSNRNSGDIVLPSIFVQIPPQSESYLKRKDGNTFLRSQQDNRDEIKSEPIKSELNESNLNTPIILPKSQSNPAFNQRNNTEASGKNSNLSNLVSARPKPLVKCYKCSQCLFISISQNNLDIHVDNCHYNNENSSNHPISQKKLDCPGCENIFYSKTSLHAHLENDHEMAKDEIHPLIESLLLVPQHVTSESLQQKSDSFEDFVNRNTQEDVQNILPESADTDENDIILAESESIDDDFIFEDQTSNDNDITEITPSIPEVETIGNAPRGKIYINNVDILRKPDFVEEHVIENENSNYNYNTVITDEINCIEPTLGNYNEYKIDNNTICSVNEDNTPRKAKIYIKNVDILKNPALEPINNIFSVPSNGVSLNIFTRIENDGQSSFCQPPAEINSNFFSRGKITIINENNLKTIPALDTTPRKSNSLHLRTVDELNLLNMNEVQNLITPALDQINLTNEENIGISSENSKNSDEAFTNGGTFSGVTYNQKSNFENFSNNVDLAPTNWTEDYDCDGFGNIIDLNSPPRNFDGKSMNAYPEMDLNTPQRTIADDNDNDHLFRCAEELINSNQEQSTDLVSWGLNSVENSVTDMVMDLEKIEDNQVVDISDDIEKSEDIQELPPVQMPERGRIYVADNLLKDSNSNAVDPLIKKNLNKAFGTKPTLITKLRKLYANVDPDEKTFKCDRDCTVRFRELEKLEYHKTCHISSSQYMQCPECNLDIFRSWDTLHTHLWRNHQIDMELYSCNYCNFKTPILSRLINTHVKIHSEERNFKCNECAMSFKNNRQLKNHRRLHRSKRTVHKCTVCSATFSYAKNLKVHYRSEHQSKVHFKCSECDEVFASKSALKQHSNTHRSVSKYDCSDCGYKTNDHNSFRRHRMIHNDKKMYACPFCEFKCVQSNVYRRHVSKIHPAKEHEIILKCQHCNFTTINRLYFNIHIARHNDTEKTTNKLINIQTDDISSRLQEAIVLEVSPESKQEPAKQIENKDKELVNKIKVRSNLVLTDPNKLVTPNLFLLKNFDNRIT